MQNYININDYNMDKIPNNVSISTMSIGCNLGTSFNMKNIYNYLTLSNDDIIAIKSLEGIRCIEELKSKFKSTNKNSKKNFYNQNTIIICIGVDRFINIKLFKNGSLQMSGCTQLLDANIAISKLIFRLSIIIKNELNDDIQFVENISDLKLVKINIDFINSNFGVNYLINKVNLYQLLTEQNILCRLTAKHACLNIKHKISSDIYISIFVFQTGSIIITGAKTAENIRDAYIFIVKFLNKHKSKIIKRDISKILSVEEFEEILKLE